MTQSAHIAFVQQKRQILGCAMYGAVYEGIVDLAALLKQMNPVLQAGEFVFCVCSSERDLSRLHPLATFAEREGMTVVVDKACADRESLSYSGVFRQITLQVHSSLHAVGLTAAVSQCLSQQGISANVIAAYYHDHVFVPLKQAERALHALRNIEM